MTRDLNLQELVQVIGPRFAEGAAERDEADAFVAEHYEILEKHKVFSALVPVELGGGGTRHSAMCVPSPACPLLSVDGAGPLDASAPGRGGGGQSCARPAGAKAA